MPSGDSFNITNSTGNRTTSTGSDSMDSTTAQLSPNVYRLKHHKVHVTRLENHLTLSDSSFGSYDLGNNDTLPQHGRNDSEDVDIALTPLRHRRLENIRDGGMFVGTTLGTIGGGAAAVLKMAAIGAAIGTMVMPGIGTGVGAALGAILGVVGGGLVGGAIGRGIGHLIGKNRSAKIDLEAVLKDHAPGTKTFDKCAKAAGYDPEDLTEETKNGINEGLERALRDRAHYNRPIGKEWIRRTLTNLIKLHAQPDIEENERGLLANSFVTQLPILGRGKSKTMDATAEALLNIYRDPELDSIQKSMTGSQFVQHLQSEASRNNVLSPTDTRSLADQLIFTTKSRSPRPPPSPRPIFTPKRSDSE
jgi:hypothetical protein